MSGAPELDNAPGGRDYFADLAIDAAPAVIREAIVDPYQPAGSSHGVKLATSIKRGQARLYVIECRCGWSSCLHPGRGDAVVAYDAHTLEAAR